MQRGYNASTLIKIRLHSRVILLDGISSGIFVPSGTCRVQSVVINESCNLRVTLHKLKSEALGCVPTDVAVHQPRSRIVGLEGNDEVAGGGKHSNVSSRGVGK